MHLVLLETSGNQNFIFSTNKLRENIGASELTYRAGTQLVMDAVADITNNQQDFNNSEQLRAALLDSTFNRPIEITDVQVEVIIATSGKALILVKDRELGKQIIRTVTTRALKDAPGLDICGVISEEFDWKDNGAVDRMNKQLHQRFESVRGQRPGIDTRFMRLPVVGECSTSGLPAWKTDPIGEGEVALRSKVSQFKRDARDDGFKRIQGLLAQRNPQWKFLGNISEFEDDFDENISWLSVVHADGNGLGQIFLDFGMDINSNRDYVDQYRQFSTAIDICTEQAFLDAIEQVFTDIEPNSEDEIIIPLVPLILGGDDLTVVCDGRYALKFTEKFLTAFETHTGEEVGLPIFEDGKMIPAQHKIITKNSRIIIDQAYKHLGEKRLSACAGITVMKKHFPFSVAYGLAEQLIKSAKTVKDIVQTTDGKTIPCSAIDYHILFDSSGVDLASIRTKLEFEQPQTHLYGRPYVVSNQSWYAHSIATDWIDRYHWSKLAELVSAINAKDADNRHLLSNSQMHDLRESLFLGQVGADARYRLIRGRYLDRNIQVLDAVIGSGSLFWQELSDDLGTEVYKTRFLDAMDAAGFWNGGN